MDNSIDLFPLIAKLTKVGNEQEEIALERLKMLNIIANRAYKSEVIDTLMEELIIGPGKEYFDRDDWIDSWFRELEKESRQ